MRCAARLAAGGGGPLGVCAGCPRVLARWSACPRVAAPVSGGADASSRPGCVLAGSCRTGEGPGGSRGDRDRGRCGPARTR